MPRNPMINQNQSGNFSKSNPLGGGVTGNFSQDPYLNMKMALNQNLMRALPGTLPPNLNMFPSGMASQSSSGFSKAPMPPQTETFQPQGAFSPVRARSIPNVNSGVTRVSPLGGVGGAQSMNDPNAPLGGIRRFGPRGRPVFGMR